MRTNTRNYTKTHYLEARDEINTACGYIRVLGYNGSGLFDCMIYGEDEETGEKGDRRYLTASDIQAEMKQVDGKNHKVIWDGDAE